MDTPDGGKCKDLSMIALHCIALHTHTHTHTWSGVCVSTQMQLMDMFALVCIKVLR